MISNRMHVMLLVTVLFLLSYGCAAPRQVMIHPTTKQQVNCSSWGFGIIGAPAALATYSECKDKYTALGYIPIEDFEKKEAPKLMKSELQGRHALGQLGTEVMNGNFCLMTRRHR